MWKNRRTFSMLCCSRARLLLAILVCLSILSIPLIGIFSVIALAYGGLSGFKEIWTLYGNSTVCLVIMFYNAKMFEKLEVLAAAALPTSSKEKIQTNRNPSNSFANTEAHAKKKFPRPKGMDNVIQVNVKDRLIVVEPGVTMDLLCKATLKYGLVPPVVTEFPGITVGGAIMGGALESSSFLFGHFADALVAIEVVLPEGKVITATATNQHQDLFWGIRGSYGTLGRLTLITLKLQSLTPKPMAPMRQRNDFAFPFRHFRVRVDFYHVTTVSKTMAIMQRAIDMGHAGPYHYIDAIAFRDSQVRAVVLMAGRRVYASDEDAQQPAREASHDWWGHRVRTLLDTHLKRRATTNPSGTGHLGDNAINRGSNDSSASRAMPQIHSSTERFGAFCSQEMTLWEYLFRYDRGAFWMGDYVTPCYCDLPLPSGLRRIGQSLCVDSPSPIFRTMMGKLGGIDTTRNLYRSLHLLSKDYLRGLFCIHDFHIPADKVLDFMHWVEMNLAITPLWLCPVKRAEDRKQRLSCHYVPGDDARNSSGEAQLRTGLVNVGVYGNTPSPETSVSLNMQMEEKATAMGGRKLMYSQLYQNAGQFWSVYDKEWYDSLRRRYVAADDTIATVPDIHKKLMFQTK